MDDRIKDLIGQIEKSTFNYLVNDDPDEINIVLDCKKALLNIFEHQQQEIKGLQESMEENEDDANRVIDLQCKEIERLNNAYEYIIDTFYTEHCTMNHMENTEFEKGKISGLINASNIVEKALGKQALTVIS